ncbi:MAG: ABC transporter substrate binding protein [Deltaproteobacteria bacterium]
MMIAAVAFCLPAIPLAAAQRQTGSSIRRIGFLSLGDPEESEAERQQFWAPARRLGWIEGDNLVVERQFASLRAELLRPLAEELVRLNVAVIITSGTDAAVAAKNATSTIPIILYSAGDPVRAGLVASLARPGGNITGFSSVSPEVETKQLELFRERASERRAGYLQR